MFWTRKKGRRFKLLRSGMKEREDNYKSYRNKEDFKEMLWTMPCHANKLDILDKMDKYVRKHKLLKLRRNRKFK